ncbi:MAG: hypothetical protein V7L23_36665 [Nostoc sp.]|uniref:hypothetical protein n=1 Tax=Nostoc sp. TaxID=1180 RepID=UPI002FF2C6BF
MSNTVQNEQQNPCRDGDLSRLGNPKLLPVALNPSVLNYKIVNLITFFIEAIHELPLHQPTFLRISKANIGTLNLSFTKNYFLAIIHTA